MVQSCHREQASGLKAHMAHKQIKFWWLLQPAAEAKFVILQYYGVYYVGTPARQFLACFDTGSGDTWLPSQACTRPACTDHDQYNPGLSSTETVRHG